MKVHDIDADLRQHAAIARLRGTPAFGDRIEHRFMTAERRILVLTARIIDVGPASTMMHLSAWSDDSFIRSIDPQDLSVRYLFERQHRLHKHDEVAARWFTLQREGWRIIERASSLSSVLSTMAKANGWKHTRVR